MVDYDVSGFTLKFHIRDLRTLALLLSAVGLRVLSCVSGGMLGEFMLMLWAIGGRVRGRIIFILSTSLVIYVCGGAVPVPLRVYSLKWPPWFNVWTWDFINL